MCRLMAYMGDSILLAHVVSLPDRSIIKQSYDARERKLDPTLPSHLAYGYLNGDGFGIGWYPCEQEECTTAPCVFRSISPAWNNDNLSRLSKIIRSPLIFAHVRAAYPGMPVSEQNCHPFQWGRYMFMHNGVVAGFPKIQRHLLRTLSDKAYHAVESSHSDSSVAFAVFLNSLPNMEEQLSPYEMLQALQKTIAVIISLQKDCGVKEVSLLNFVVSDGSTLVATRFVYPETETPASMYYAEGHRFHRSSSSATSDPEAKLDTGLSDVESQGQYELSYGERGTRVAIVASEPITGTSSDWVALPKNTALVISREKSGFVSLVKAPLTASGDDPREEEVSRCLEAVGRGIGVTARVWNIPSRLPSTSSPSEKDPPVLTTEDHRLSGHGSTVLCMVLDHSKEKLFSGSLDGFIKVWNLAERKHICNLKGHSKPVIKLHGLKDLLFSTAGLEIRVWDIESYACLYMLGTCEGSGPVRSLSVQDTRVYCGSQDSKVKIFILDPSRLNSPEKNTPDDGMLRWSSSTDDTSSHLSVVNSLEVCGKYVCSAGGDTTVRVWSLYSLEPVRVLRGHRGSILTLKSIGETLLSGGRDNTIRVWDIEALLCRRTLTGHKDDIMHIAALGTKVNSASKLHAERSRRSSFSPEGPCLVATASADCTIRIWSPICWATLRILDLCPPDPVPPAPGHPCMTPLAVTMTPGLLVAGLRGGALLMWSIEDLVCKMQAAFRREIGCSIDFSGQDSIAAVSSAECHAYRRQIAERELEAHLKTFVRFRTVSGDPDCQEDCFKGAKFLASLLEDLGAEVKLVEPFEGKNPIIIGRVGNKPNVRTVTFYGHYDVQPANKSQWETDPFRMQAIDGYFYGRGTSDNKGPILAFIYAVKDLLEIEESVGIEGLPLNIAFFFEGEEENGSRGARAALQNNIRWFENTCLTVMCNTQWVGEEIPCLTYGMRGMLSMNVEVIGSMRDVHSGNDGGVFNEPLIDLVRVLSTLTDSHNNIQVPGFYDNVRSTLLDAAWPGLENSGEFSLERYQEHLGVPALSILHSRRTLLESRWCQPTLSIVDMRPGSGLSTASESKKSNALADYHRFGPTCFSVIPGAAVGKISVRFVPDQDKDYLIRCITSHIEYEFAKLRSRSKVNVSVVTCGDWWDSCTSSKLFRVAEHAIAEEWGEKPLFVREGGTMPMASVFEKVLGAPALLIPMGQASDNCHLANERIRVINLIKGKNVIRRLLLGVARCDCS